MRIRLHLILSLIFGVTLVSLAFAYYQVRAEKRGLRGDLETRAEILAESLEETIVPLLQRRSQKDLLRIVERFGNRERLAGVVVYDERGSTLAITSGLSGRLTAPPDAVALAMSQNSGRGEFRTLGQAYVHLYVLPLHQEEKVVGALAIFHDANYIEAQSGRIWRDTFLRVSVQTLLIALITLLIIRWSIKGPIAKTAQWMRELRVGGAHQRPSLSDKDIFKPLTQEVTHFVKSRKRRGRQQRRKPGYARRPSRSGRQHGSGYTFRTGSKAVRYSWSPTVSLICTFAEASRLK